MKKKIKAKKRTPSQQFMAMSDAEKEAEFESYNRIIPLSESRPLTPAERRQFERFRRGAGRPRIGKGAKVVAISLEKDLLKESDGFARKNGVKRSELIAAGLRAVMKNPALLAG